MAPFSKRVNAYFTHRAESRDGLPGAVLYSAPRQ